MMNKNLTKKKKKGFTLIELIVVIAILGVLAAVAIPKFGSKTDDAKVQADKLTAKNIAMAVQTEITSDTKINDKKLIEVKSDQAKVQEFIVPKYFATFPTPQSTTTYTAPFVIVVDANGNVTINDSTSGAAKKLYP